MLFTSDLHTDIRSGFNKIEKRLQKLEDNIDNNNEVEQKLDTLIEILKPDHEILIDEYKLDSLMITLTKYFNARLKEYTSDDYEGKIPKGTLEVMAKLNQFNDYWTETRTKWQKTKYINDMNTLRFNNPLGRDKHQ